jgi:hypothetical protein
LILSFQFELLCDQNLRLLNPAINAAFLCYWTNQAATSLWVHKRISNYLMAIVTVQLWGRSHEIEKDHFWKSVGMLDDNVSSSGAVEWQRYGWSLLTCIGRTDHYVFLNSISAMFSTKVFRSWGFNILTISTMIDGWNGWYFYWSMK